MSEKPNLSAQLAKLRLEVSQAKSANLLQKAPLIEKAVDSMVEAMESMAVEQGRIREALKALSL